MDAPQIENGMALLTGSGPVSKLSDYQKELNTYAKGRGKFFCTLQGYEVCQNQDEVVEVNGYQPEADLYNEPEANCRTFSAISGASSVAEVIVVFDAYRLTGHKTNSWTITISILSLRRKLRNGRPVH